MLELFEDELGEVVEAVFPDHEVVAAIGVFDEGAGHALLIAEGLEARAVEHQTVVATTDHPQQLVLLLGCLYIRNQLFRLLGVGSRGEATDIGKLIEVAQTEVERLSATH